MSSQLSPNNSVGARVRAARVSRMWTQERLAEKSGVGRVTIARIEAGTTVPRMRSVRALAAALEVEPESLVPDPHEVW
jgi:transcriptional regulator with XRE-family HTH domain